MFPYLIPEIKNKNPNNIISYEFIFVDVLCWPMQLRGPLENGTYEYEWRGNAFCGKKFSGLNLLASNFQLLWMRCIFQMSIMYSVPLGMVTSPKHISFLRIRVRNGTTGKNLSDSLINASKYGIFFMSSWVTSIFWSGKTLRISSNNFSCVSG